MDDNHTAVLDAAALERLDTLAGAASRGPWECREADGTAAVLTQDGWLDSCSGEQEVANARFIAEANPQTIRTLVALARRAAQLEEATRPKTEAQLRAEFELALKGNNLRRFDKTLSHACYVDSLIENLWQGWLRKASFDARQLRANLELGA